MTDPHTKDKATLGRIAERIALGLAAPPAGSPPTEAHDPVLSITPAAQHLARLAHELKTPLSAIVAAAEIMRDARFGPIGDARYQDYAAGIYDSAHHALGVINAMLGAASGEGHPREHAAYAELDLNKIVSEVALSVAALVEAAGLAVAHHLQPGLPHVIADPVTVRQMLLNLVTNAMRATLSGGTILIKTAYDLAGPVHLIVTDTGSGMSDADIARALDPTRPADFEPRASGGLGLGYPLILNLAQLNGATVAISSAPGQGTAVCITFAADRVIPV